MSRHSFYKDEEWDPMQEDYYDPTFNSYTHGPGSKLDRCLQPSYPRAHRENAVFKLHVRKVPELLSETGVRNLFMNFGNPIHVYRPAPELGLDWAHVTYATHSEAELAIRKLNNMPPFFLKVQFARSAADKERIQLEREQSEMLLRVLEEEPYPVQKNIPYSPFNRGIGRGRAIPFIQNRVLGHRPGKFLIEDEMEEELPSYSPYHIPGPCGDNRMVLPEMHLTFNSASGKRRVSMGRGHYVPSEPSNQHNFVIKPITEEEKARRETLLDKMFDRVTNGVYEFGEKVDLSGVSGNCAFCDQMTTQKCGRCGDWYCSRECQVTDWPRHKPLCIPLPSLDATAKSRISIGSQGNIASEQQPSVYGKQQRGNKEQGDGDHNTQFSKDNYSKKSISQEDQNVKENCNAQNKPPGLNRNVNDQFGAARKGNYRPKDSPSDRKTNYPNNQGTDQKHEHFPGSSGAAGMKKTSVNERLHAVRQMNESPLIAQNKPAPKQKSEIVQTPPTDTGVVKRTTKPLSESTPKLNVTKEDMPVTKTSLLGSPPIKPSGKIEPSPAKISAELEVQCTETATTDSLEKVDELPKGTFTKVKVTVPVGPSEYWVQLVDSESKLLNVMSVLFEDSECIPLSVNELQVGSFCAAQYEELWYRGRIRSIKPELKVHYVDYGNEELCTSDKIKTLPPSLKDIPALAQRIKLATGTGEKYNNLVEESALSVKPVGKFNKDVTIVHVEGEVYPQQEEMVPAVVEQSISKRVEYTPLPRPKQHTEVTHLKEQSHSCAVENLKVGTKGAGQFTQQLKSGDFTITLFPLELKEEYGKLCKELSTVCEKIPADEKYKPAVGEIVAIYLESENAWYRGHILSFNNAGYCVSLCDKGCVSTVQNIRKLPREFAAIPEFAARCNVVTSSIPSEQLCIKGGNQFFFTVTDTDETRKTATCVFRTKDEKEMCKATLKRWYATTEEIGLRVVELKNNDKVVLSVFFNQKSLFIRPVSCNEALSRLLQDIGLHCLKVPELDHMPVKNELVASKYESDGNFYRARVISIENKNIRVAYIDYGNQDIVSKGNLRPLSEELKRIPCMSVKVSLKDVSTKPLTEEANILLSRLTGEEVEMKLIYSGSYKDGVELMLESGVSLNDEINKCLEPDWKKAISSGKDPIGTKHFSDSDVQYVELPVGETIDILVVNKFDSVSFLVTDASGSEKNAKIMDYICTKMQNEINEYCNAAPQKSYVPRDSELCFAKYEDGMWYRAEYLGDAGKDNILFLDYGNTSYIDKTNIRRMVPEYVDIPAMAVFCKIGDLETASETVKQRVNQLIQINTKYKAHITSSSDPGSYNVEFPHVKEVLLKEKLLVSGSKNSNGLAKNKERILCNMEFQSLSWGK